MRQRSADLFLVIGITIITVALIFIVPSDGVALRILALPLALVLPGYALVAACTSNKSFGLPESLVFTLGLNLAVVILGGLILNWMPSGLNAYSWVLFLATITFIASAIAFVRRQGQNVRPIQWPTGKQTGFTFRQGLLPGLAGVVVLAATTISIVGAAQQPHTGFTQFWILPVRAAGSGHAVRIGITNMEPTVTRYSINVSMDNKPVEQWLSISLKPNQQWESQLLLPQNSSVAKEVEAALYRMDMPTKIYRHVTLSLSAP